jgi:hypothetical protein
VAARAIEDVDVVTASQEGGPVGPRAGHQEQAVEEATKVWVSENERRAELGVGLWATGMAFAPSGT